MTSERNRFIIRINDEEWPSLSWHILRRTSPLPQDGIQRKQESNLGWLMENYRTSLIHSHPRLLPELIPTMITGLYRKLDEDDDWVDERLSVVQSILAACCLVSREWYGIFCPILYENIFLGETNPLLTRSLLHRTFHQTQPAHKALVKTMTIALAEDGSTTNLLSICFSLPNLQKLILDFGRSNLSTLHPNFVEQLRSLSKSCAIHMVEDAEGDVNIGTWGSLPSFINFTRRSRSTSCRFWAGYSGGR